MMDDVNVIYYDGTLDRPFNPPLNHGGANRRSTAMTCNETSIIRMSINGNANYPNTGYLNDRLSEKGTNRVYYTYGTTRLTYLKPLCASNTTLRYMEMSLRSLKINCTRCPSLVGRSKWILRMDSTLLKHQISNN